MNFLKQVDAHVGAHLFNEAILGILKEKTRVLVTNALHILPHADMVVVIKEGRIVERGTFNELLETGDEFSSFAKQHGVDKAQESSDAVKTRVVVAPLVKKEKTGGKAEIGKAGRPLQQKEDQATGSISWKVWREYGKAANGYVTIPLMFLALFLMGASQGERASSPSFSPFT